MVVALAFLRRGGFLISDGNSLSPLLLAAFLDFLLLVVGFFVAAWLWSGFHTGALTFLPSDSCFLLGWLRYCFLTSVAEAVGSLGLATSDDWLVSAGRLAVWPFRWTKSAQHESEKFALSVSGKR